MSYRLKGAVALSVLTLATSVFAQSADTQPQRIRGDIVSVDGNTLKLHRASGTTVSIALQDNTPVAAVRKIALSDIKAGSFIGTAATTGHDGKLTAREVVVFPEAARGTGEGHYAWDLGAHSTMTNANVDSVVQGTQGRNLKLSYKGGSTDVTVPDNVPVVTVIPATHADLVAGKKAFIVATPASGGGFSAQRVIVEKDGVPPPM
ncbi:MAG: hypothetical protein ACRYG5_12250 [Janthinobacterium lividum]